MRTKMDIRYRGPNDAENILDIFGDFLDAERDSEEKVSEYIKKVIGRLLSGDWGQGKASESEEADEGFDNVVAMFKDMDIEDSKRQELSLILYRAMAAAYIGQLIVESGVDLNTFDVVTGNLWILKALNKNDFYEEGLRGLYFFSHNFNDKEIEKINKTINTEVDWLRDNEENIKTI